MKKLGILSLEFLSQKDTNETKLVKYEDKSVVVNIKL